MRERLTSSLRRVPVLRRRLLDRLVVRLFSRIPIGSRDDLDVDEFIDGFERVVGAVAALRRTDNEVGTGFLISDSLLLTAHHVLPDKSVAETTTARFKSGSHRLDPSVRFWTNEDLDYSVVAVDASGLRAAPLASDAVLARHDDVFLIHHPGGGSMHISYAENEIVHIDERVIRYRADTEHGSSGAPVCDRRWRVVAMHHEGGRFGDAAGARRELLNEGVRASAIARDLVERGA